MSWSELRVRIFGLLGQGIVDLDSGLTKNLAAFNGIIILSMLMYLPGQSPYIVALPIDFAWTICVCVALHAVSWACMQFLSLSEQLTRISQCSFF